MQLTCPVVLLCFILIIPATTSGPISTGISVVIGMAKLFANLWLVDEISNNDFPLKYVDEVRYYSGIRFYEDLTSWERFWQDKNYHMNRVSYIHRFSVYCRSNSGKYRDAFTKFSNHFRGEKKIKMHRIYDVLKIYLQEAGGNILDMQVKLLAKKHTKVVIRRRAVYTYVHEIEIWLP